VCQSHRSIALFKQSEPFINNITVDRIHFDLTTAVDPLYGEPLTRIITAPNDWIACAAVGGVELYDLFVTPKGMFFLTRNYKNGSRRDWVVKTVFHGATGHPFSAFDISRVWGKGHYDFLCT
jgi:hypothetical protein